MLTFEEGSLIDDCYYLPSSSTICCSAIDAFLFERLSFAAMKVFCGDTGADEDETILAAGKSAAEAD